MLSAAAAFVAGLRAFAIRREDEYPFKTVYAGGIVPVIVLSLLLPGLITLYSGIITFDDDVRFAALHARTASQLEQFEDLYLVTELMDMKLTNFATKGK